MKMDDRGRFRFLSQSFLFIILIVFEVSCSITDDKIYITLNSTTYGSYNSCFRRFNGTHQFGCSSIPGDKGNIGVAHLISNTSGLSWFLENEPHKEYVIIITPHMFTSGVVKKLQSSGKVNGMVLIRENKTYPASGFSDDRTCPNVNSDMYSTDSEYQCQQRESKWNPTGSGLEFEDLNMPLFIVDNQTEIDELYLKCWARNSPLNRQPRDFPLCGLELKATMLGAQNSESCWRRSNMVLNLNPETYCDPMGDHSVYGTFKAVLPSETLPDKSIVIAAARLDAFSLFKHKIPGANSPVASVVALLAAAEALGKNDTLREKLLQSQNDIMFMLFQGEAYDYIGSSRVAWDMMNKTFRSNRTHADKGLHNIAFKHLKGFVEVGQVGMGLNTKKLWIHSDPISRKKREVDTQVRYIMATLLNSAAGLKFQVDTDLNSTLPPASLQSFLKQDNSVPGVVIADHNEKAYKNLYYNSIYDEADKINASYPDGLLLNDSYDHVTEQAIHLTEVATMLAKTLYTLATEDDSDTTALEASSTTVTHLLYCFLFKPTCPLFKEILDWDDAAALSDTPYPFYVGVFGTQGEVSILARRLLAYYIGETANTTWGDMENTNTTFRCKILQDLSNREGSPWNYIAMQGMMKDDGSYTGLCKKTLANYTEAASPAFFLPDYDYASGTYPTWTESVWDSSIYVRMFMIPSQRIGTITLSVGVIILLASFVVTYFVARRSDILFPSSGDSTSTY